MAKKSRDGKKRSISEFGFKSSAATPLLCIITKLLKLACMKGATSILPQALMLAFAAFICWSTIVMRSLNVLCCLKASSSIEFNGVLDWASAPAYGYLVWHCLCYLQGIALTQRGVRQHPQPVWTTSEHRGLLSG